MARIIETITKPTTDKPCKSAEEMEEVCCKPTGALQCCEKKEPWNGYSGEEVLKKAGISVDDQGFDSQGRFVEVRFTPRIKACGEKVTKYDTTPGKCCDQVEPLAVDYDNSAEIIADYSTGMIYVIGGRLPLRVQVSGTGFYVADDNNPASGYRDAEVFGRVIPIKTLDACGRGVFTISDGCSTSTHSVKSTSGEWAVVEAGNTVGPILAASSILPMTDFVMVRGYGHIYGELGGIRVFQDLLQDMFYWGYACADSASELPYSFCHTDCSSINTCRKVLPSVDDPYSGYPCRPGSSVDDCPNENQPEITGTDPWRTTNVQSYIVSEWRC